MGGLQTIEQIPFERSYVGSLTRAEQLPLKVFIICWLNRGNNNSTLFLPASPRIFMGALPPFLPVSRIYFLRFFAPIIY